MPGVSAEAATPGRHAELSSRNGPLDVLCTTCPCVSYPARPRRISMDCHLARRDAGPQVNAHGAPCRIVARNTLERRYTMFQHEARRDEWQGEALGYAGDARWEEATPDSMSGQKLIPDAPGQAPTVGQRLALALVSLGMLMGMSTLLTILATATRSPGSLAVPLLFVLTLFTVAVVSINVIFHRRS